MVDLAEIQAAYYMVAATGVLVAAIYYVYNMRAAERNKNRQPNRSKLWVWAIYLSPHNNGGLCSSEFLAA